MKGLGFHSVVTVTLIVDVISPSQKILVDLRQPACSPAEPSFTIHFYFHHKITTFSHQSGSTDFGLYIAKWYDPAI